MGMLGTQVILKQVYRPLRYVLTAEEEKNKIYYNLLTHEMIAVNNSEIELPETRKYLIENWYLVPEEYNEQQLVDECRAVLTLMNSWPKKIHIFHIFTTLDCNARCFYCFEKRVPGLNMTTETATRAIEYMQEKADGEPIKIIWFGGEPLFNYPIIDYIANRLNKKGMQFESSMYSNGLLFDNTMVEKAKTLWNVKDVQITLDGTSKVYRKIKAYVTEIENPFERVLQNIKSLLMVAIKVKIRLNIGPHNYNDMRDLVDFLCEEFKGEDNLFIYTSPLFEIREYTVDKREYLYDLLDELNSKLDLSFGKERKLEFSDKIVNSICMASGREAVTILPNGEVGICLNDADNSLIGDIYNDEVKESVREEYGKRFYREDKCRLCPLYPNCYIVNGCPNKDDREGCDSIWVQRQIGKIKEKMVMKYKKETFCEESRNNNFAREFKG